MSDSPKAELARVIWNAIENQATGSCHYASEESSDLKGVTLDGQFDLQEIAERVIEYQKGN